LIVIANSFIHPSSPPLVGPTFTSPAFEQVSYVKRLIEPPPPGLQGGSWNLTRPHLLQFGLASHAYVCQLRGGQDVTVSCAFAWGDGKTFRVDQQFHSSDGTLVAEIVSIGGLMNIAERRLIADPGEHWRVLASTPELLGL
jgi:hypothetical protein